MSGKFPAEKDLGGKEGPAGFGDCFRTGIGQSEEAAAARGN